MEKRTERERRGRWCALYPSEIAQRKPRRSVLWQDF